ncbi:hypothetical protein HK102_000314 [Quaeritorhiza haematococci]|nr:hypothetical protein HK102_000314 [Quaeritorhiza haematococci]
MVGYVKPTDIGPVSAFYQGYLWRKIQKESAAELPTPNFPFKDKLNRKVAIWEGDITRLELDAIVNAANKSLLGGGGVDGAIHRAAGRDLLAECRTLNGCDTGDAKITRGYRLPAKHVIHTVGPVGEKPLKLRSCYIRSLEVLTENNLRTVAFPYPNGPAAHVALAAVREWLETDDNADKVDLIVFCIFLPIDSRVYHKTIPFYFPPPTSTQNTSEEAGTEGQEASDSDAEGRKAD